MENRNSVSQNHFDTLPNEVIDLLLDFININDFGNLAQTCKRLQQRVFNYPVKFVTDIGTEQRSDYRSALIFFKNNADQYKTCLETYNKHKQSVLNIYVDEQDPEDPSLQALNLVPMALAVILAIGKNKLFGPYSFNLIATGTVASAVLGLVSTKYRKDVNTAKADLDEAERKAVSKIMRKDQRTAPKNNGFS